jgi:hypothetical protein
MKKLMAVLTLGAVMLWGTAGFAAEYSALADQPLEGPYIGFGGLVIAGDNNAATPSSDSEFLGSVVISGLSDYLAWQAFYAMGQDATVLGGSADYILFDNFDQCYTCPGQGLWWFGVGPTIVNVSDLYVDSTVAGSEWKDETWLGGNLGFGYIMGPWQLQLWGHYLQESQMMVQGQVLYNFNK